MKNMTFRYYSIKPNTSIYSEFSYNLTICGKFKSIYSLIKKRTKMTFYKSCSSPCQPPPQSPCQKAADLPASKRSHPQM